ncbi:MAG: 3TM-type holin [Sphaerochaeta sp.]|jgi:hypothetical protein|nr:3TM-type holin [Sphaerochaeta sp.]
MADWKQVGKRIATMGASVLGTAVAGPAGGAGLGGLVASLFGADPEDPADVLSRMQLDPQAAVKLRELELRHVERIEEIQLDTLKLRLSHATSSIQAVNKTMQVEATSEHWAQWGWRPFWGFISGTAFFIVCAFVCYLGYQAIVLKDGTAFGQIPLVIGSFTTLFGIPGAILGITAWGRNALKTVKSQSGGRQ